MITLVVPNFFYAKFSSFFSFQLFIAKVVKEKLLKNEQVMNMYGYVTLNMW